MNDSNSGATPPTPEEERDHARLTLWQIVSSTLAAAFGVQSSRNRTRDFTTGKPTHFIVAGFLFTILFVVGLIFLVRLVVSAAS